MTKNWQEGFDEKFEEATIPMETDGGWATNSCSEELKQFISDLIAQTREETMMIIKKDLIKIADAGEYEDLRREVEYYFK